MKDKLTKKQAKEVISFDKNNMAHTFYNTAGMLVGGDHSKKSLFKDIDNSFMCKITGSQALGFGHGLAIIPEEKCKQSDLIFVETKDSFNKKQIKILNDSEKDENEK